jgi:hypothetical protein
MEKVKLLLRNKLFVKSILLAGLAAAGLSLPPEAVDVLVSLVVSVGG